MLRHRSRIWLRYDDTRFEYLHLKRIPWRVSPCHCCCHGVFGKNCWNADINLSLMEIVDREIFSSRVADSSPTCIWFVRK